MDPDDGAPGPPASGRRGRRSGRADELDARADLGSAPADVLQAAARVGSTWLEAAAVVADLENDLGAVTVQPNLARRRTGVARDIRARLQGNLNQRRGRVFETG